MNDPLTVARNALAQARAYETDNVFEAAERDRNIANLEAYIAARTNRPAGKGPGPGGAA